MSVWTTFHGNPFRRLSKKCHSDLIGIHPLRTVDVCRLAAFMPTLPITLKDTKTHCSLQHLLQIVRAFPCLHPQLTTATCSQVHSVCGHASCLSTNLWSCLPARYTRALSSERWEEGRAAAGDLPPSCAGASPLWPTCADDTPTRRGRPGPLQSPRGDGPSLFCPCWSLHGRGNLWKGGRGFDRRWDQLGKKGDVCGTWRIAETFYWLDESASRVKYQFLSTSALKYSR